MTSREKFEAFLVSEYEWGNDALNAANFHGDDATGYYTGGDFIYDGQSCSECLFWAWRGWQAAELASEQKLTDMAVQLANAESKRRELAAENAALKAVESNLVRNIINDLGDTEFQYEKVQTPASDAFLAEVRAQGVEMYADNLDSSADDAERDGFDDAVKFLRSEASGVRLFAAQLRQEAK